MYVCVSLSLNVCVCVYGGRQGHVHVSAIPLKPEKGIGFPGPGVTTLNKHPIRVL